MELIVIWETILRRKWILIQAMLVVSLGSLVMSYLAVPPYRADSKILLLKAQKGVIDIGSVGSQLASIIKTSADVDVNRVMASSRPYIDKMVFRLQLRNEDGDLIKAYQPEGEGFKDRISPKPYVTVTQFRDTDILVVRGSSPDPEEAMMMANTLSGIMVEQNQILMRAEYKSARDFLEKHVDKVRKTYDAALLDLAEFQKKEQTIDLNIETKLASEKMMELLKQKEVNVIDLMQIQAKLNHLNRELAKQSPEYLSASALKASPQLVTLKKRLTELRLRLADVSTELMPKHPEILVLKEKIKLASDELAKEIAVYRETAPELVALEKQQVSLEAHLKAVNADIDRYFKALGGIPDKAYQQASIDKELAAARQTYSRLLDFMYQMGIAEASTLSEIRIIEEAIRPPRPEEANKAVNVIMGLVVGFIFGLGLAFFMEYLDDSIKKAEDLKPYRPIDVISTVPRFDPGQPVVISRKDPNDPICESYRKIRNHMKSSEKPINGLLVTSAGPGEGKTTTVVNLGISGAREGKRVLILDADIRRARLHTFFGLSNETGLVDYLQGKLSLERVIHATEVENLHIMPSGSSFLDPGQLIESDGMGQLISDLKAKFDMVILDSAPILVKSDALVLAGHTESSILVLESGKTTKRAIHGVLDLMAGAGIRPMGFVLNKVPVQKGRHSYQHYYQGHYGAELPAGEGM